MKATMAFLIFFWCSACMAQQDDPIFAPPDIQIELDSLMRISEIRFLDGSKRKYEYRKEGIYLMRLYDRKGRLNSTVLDRMDPEEAEEKGQIRPFGHIERLR